MIEQLGNSKTKTRTLEFLNFSIMGNECEQTENMCGSLEVGISC